MIACINIPYFAAAVERRDDSSLAKRPIVIGGQHWEPRPVYGFSQEAARVGVRARMPLRQAHLLSPAAHFLPPAQPRYRGASGETVDVLTDFTPLIEPEDLWLAELEMMYPVPLHHRFLPAHYHLDLESLPVKEVIPFVQHIGRMLRQETKLAPAIGLGQSKFTAQVAATTARINHLRPVLPGQEVAFLAPQPLSFLPFDRETRRRLHLLGVDTLGQLTALPLSALRDQFGPAIVPLYRRAQGKGEAAIRPSPLEPLIHVDQQFDAPIGNQVTLAALLMQIAFELARRLQTAVLEGRELHLRWETEGTAAGQTTLYLRQPTANPDRITTTLQEWLQTLQLASGMLGLSVTIGNLSPAHAIQLSLLHQAAAEAQGQQAARHIARKHGVDCFFQPQLTDAHHPLPERRFLLQPLETLVYDPAVV